MKEEKILFIKQKRKSSVDKDENKKHSSCNNNLQCLRVICSPIEVCSTLNPTDTYLFKLNN